MGPMGQVPEIEAGGAAGGQDFGPGAARGGAPWPGRSALRGLLARVSGPIVEAAGPADAPIAHRIQAAFAPVRRRVAEHAPDLAVGAVVAGLVASAGWLLSALITFGVWGLSAPDSASSAAAFHVAGQLWLSAHHVLLDAPDGPFGLTPLGFTLLPLAAFCFAGRFCARRYWTDPGHALDAAVQRHPAARDQDPAQARGAAGYAGRTHARAGYGDTSEDEYEYLDTYGARAALHRGHLHRLTASWFTPRDPRAPHARGRCELWALGALVLCYPVASLLVAWTAAAGTLHAAVGTAVGYPALLAVTAFGVGVASVRRPLTDRRFSAAVPAVATVFAILVGVAALSVAVMMVVHARRMGAVGALVGRGPAGESGLFLIDLALAPNLLVWALSFLAGPGFALGVGSSISVLGVRHGALPGLPVLQAVPDTGLSSRWLLLVLAVPLAAAVGALVQVLRRLSDPRDQLVAYAGAGVASAFLVAVAATLSGGPVAFGPMSLVGPGPGVQALAMVAEFLLIGVIGFGARAAAAALGVEKLRLRRSRKAAGADGAGGAESDAGAYQAGPAATAPAAENPSTADMMAAEPVVATPDGAVPGVVETDGAHPAPAEPEERPAEPEERPAEPVAATVLVDPPIEVLPDVLPTVLPEAPADRAE